MYKDFVITNNQGLHARPATLLVAKANSYTANRILLTYEDQTVDLKSIMGLLSLSIPKGSLVRVTVEGEHAASILESISDTVAEINASS
jgi:phosphocarrier protein